MKHTRRIVRVAAAVLALLLLATTLVSGLGMRGFAADDVSGIGIITIRENSLKGITSKVIEPDETYGIFFDFIVKGPTEALKTSIDKDNMRSGSDDWRIIRRDSQADYVVIDLSEDEHLVSGQIVARYEGEADSSRNLTVDFFDVNEGNAIISISLNVEGFLDKVQPPTDPVDNGNVPDNTDVDEPPPPIVPEIVVENMIALDSAGNKIDEVTEDTPSFTVEVVFADIGLQHIPIRYLRDRDLEAYVTTPGGFALGSSARGTMELVTQADYPRFRARFTDVTYTGGDNTLGFTVFYDLHNLDEVETHKGTGTGTLYAAEAKEDGTEEDGAGIKVPKIIISAYSYGEEAIFAGDEFPLDFTVTNTSADLALENIVITMTPAAPEGADKGPGLIVASSSNTIYLPALGPGASQSNSVSFKARPDAEVTSHLVNVRFSYEYQKSEKEGYVAAPELSESIAIPVSQIDRFTVDPIQDAPYAEAGQEAYLTVTFINKGKSPTYNISGTVKIDESVSAPPQHFGNLEAGASDSLDFFLTGSMPGTFEGEVILQYEDDNGTVNEVASPFTMTVEEPWVPDFGPGMEDPGMMEPPPPAGPNIWTIVLCAVGGLAIAVPLALTLMKRVRRKGREEFDETV